MKQWQAVHDACYRALEQCRCHGTRRERLVRVRVPGELGGAGRAARMEESSDIARCGRILQGTIPCAKSNWAVQSTQAIEADRLVLPVRARERRDGCRNPFPPGTVDKGSLSAVSDGHAQNAPRSFYRRALIAAILSMPSLSCSGSPRRLPGLQPVAIESSCNLAEENTHEP